MKIFNGKIYELRYILLGPYSGDHLIPKVYYVLLILRLENMQSVSTCIMSPIELKIISFNLLGLCL